MTDEEISIAKAMLANGMANDHVHFFFNKADRLISSGRIAQIKSGKYGAGVPRAAAAELGMFLEVWNGHQHQKGDATQHPTSVHVLTGMFEESVDGWILRIGETETTECKRSFRPSPEAHFGDVIRSIAGMANNIGGYIFFGVDDGTFLAKGLGTSLFETTDPAAINRTLAGALDPIPIVTKVTFMVADVKIGALYVAKHEQAPVVALKNIANDVKEGTIYYRYVGETRAIKPGELRQIIAFRIQRAVADFAHRMSRVARGSDATLNLDTGQVEGTTGRFVVHRDLLDRIQFLRAGDFSEIKGAPALRLIGEVEPISSAERERVKVIRETITPDSIIRNFLRDEKVELPFQYLQAQVHQQRRWFPVWFYVRQTGLDVGEVIRQLLALTATHPAGRDAIIKRLNRKLTARQPATPNSKALIFQVSSGTFEIPTNLAQEMAFAMAVQRMDARCDDPKQIRATLLRCLDGAQTHDVRASSRRSSIYRAACRLDEVLYSK